MITSQGSSVDEGRKAISNVPKTEIGRVDSIASRKSSKQTTPSEATEMQKNLT